MRSSRATPTPSAATAVRHEWPQQGSDHMFLFFSNRLGCFGSLLLSAAVTIVLILLFTR